MRTPPNDRNEEPTTAGSTCNGEFTDQTNKAEEKSENIEISGNCNKLGGKLKELENMMAGQRHVNQAICDLLTR